MNAYTADREEKPSVVIPAHECTLPGVLKLIEAGHTVIVVPAPRRPPD